MPNGEILPEQTENENIVEPIEENTQVEQSEKLSEIIELLEKYLEDEELTEEEKALLEEEEKKEAEQKQIEAELLNNNADKLNTLSDSSNDMLLLLQSLHDDVIPRLNQEEELIAITGHLETLVEQQREITQADHVINVYGLIIIPAALILYGLSRLIKPFI